MAEEEQSGRVDRSTFLSWSPSRLARAAVRQWWAGVLLAVHGHVVVLVAESADLPADRATWVIAAVGIIQLGALGALVTGGLAGALAAEEGHRRSRRHPLRRLWVVVLTTACVLVALTEVLATGLLISLTPRSWWLS